MIRQSLFVISVIISYERGTHELRYRQRTWSSSSDMVPWREGGGEREEERGRERGRRREGGGEREESEGDRE